MSGGHRKERVGQLLLQELGRLLARRVKDPAPRAVTLTEVQMSPDLTVATVYYAVSDARAEAAAAGLERATPFLRREVGSALRLKRTPELRFVRDQAIEQGERIDGLLRELSGEPPREEP